MDKNYNVDDILSEIKRRKMTERERADTARPPRPVRERAEPRPEREIRTAQPEPAPSPPPVREARPVREAPPVREAKPASGGFDFKLDEKALEQKWDGEPAQKSSKRPPRAKPEPVPEAAEKPAAPKRAPLDYGGHVQPLTDRAKIRGRYEKLAQGRGEPVLGIDEEEGERIRRELAATQEHTRVLPKSLRHTFSTGRELKLEDIRRMDFGALAQGETDGYYEDDDELADGLPESSVTDFGEYNSVGDRRDVARDIAKTKLWLFIRTAVTAILCGTLFYYVLCGANESLPMPKAIFPEPETMRAYMITLTALTGLVLLFGSSTVGGGIANLFKLRANSDTLCSLAALAALAQGVAGIIHPELVDPQALCLYFPVAALAMLANAVAKLSVISRIQANFRVITASSKKSALLAVESDHLCHELIREPSRRRPTIAFGAKAGFFTDFLALSFSDKYDVGVNRAVAPVCLLGAVTVATFTYFLTESMFDAVSALAAILCVCATLSAAFIEAIPLSRMAKKLTPTGCMVSGNKAVEDFCDTKAVILEERDLFPRGHVSLHGIKAFSRGRIDEAILDAASVICALDGALSPLFLDIIGGNKKLLRRVDNIVYESGMGVSAWVDQRRVLIGNRLLMQNHGISMPTDKYEQGLVSAQGEPIYLSNSGEVSARFLVDYIIDDELAVQLDALSARGKKIFIHTTDPNITPRKIWEVYGYPEALIAPLASENHALYREISAPRDTAVAGIVYNGKASSMIASILACVNARASILSATVVQMIQIVLGYGLVAFMAFMGFIGDLTILELTVYQLFWFVAIFVIQQTRQP